VNSAHLHLMVNHLPLFAALFSGVFLMVGLVRAQSALTKAGLVIAVVAGLGAFTAARTGEGAEEIVEELAGISEAAIEPHEEAAEAATLAAIGLGLFALAALLLPDRWRPCGAQPRSARWSWQLPRSGWWRAPPISAARFVIRRSERQPPRWMGRRRRIGSRGSTTDHRLIPDQAVSPSRSATGLVPCRA